MNAIPFLSRSPWVYAGVHAGIHEGALHLPTCVKALKDLVRRIVSPVVAFFNRLCCRTAPQPVAQKLRIHRVQELPRRADIPAPRIDIPDNEPPIRAPFPQPLWRTQSRFLTNGVICSVEAGNDIKTQKVDAIVRGVREGLEKGAAHVIPPEEPGPIRFIAKTRDLDDTDDPLNVDTDQQVMNCVKNTLEALARQPNPPKSVAFPLLGRAVYQVDESVTLMQIAIKQYARLNIGGFLEIKIVVDEVFYQEAKEAVEKENPFHNTIYI